MPLVIIIVRSISLIDLNQGISIVKTWITLPWNVGRLHMKRDNAHTMILALSLYSFGTACSKHDLLYDVIFNIPYN